jgi:protein arginine N-methyltransferase 1
MLKDAIRMNAYEEAIRRTVKPGAVVLDIGTGTGIHALMAARQGARHVYAIEPAEAVSIARDLARTNGLSDRITFIQERSTRVVLPERADVLISDLHGTLPWYEHHIPTVADARERLLIENAVVIPERDTVYMGAVAAPDLYSVFVEPWQSRPFGFQMDEVALRLTNSFSRGRVERDALLSQVATVAELDYYKIRDPNVEAAVSLRIDKAGSCHGLIVWFDTVLHGDITLTSAPFEPEISYGSAFFPLTRPVSVEEGDRLEAQLKGVLQGESYVWRWSTHVTGGDGTTRARFEQNSLAVQIPSLQRLMKRAPEYRPRLSSHGAVDRAILGLMDGRLTVEQIAQRIRAMDDDLPSDIDVLERVRALSEEYG